ncbi:sensor histidine kinase [Shimia haliotis]|uniref:histidine kinase n=1 Tax=Shimia haliotis TaxID=1280847 RepID=A0A1I4C5K4_9RHOB|nr:HAMP domain-containing sensor histidine kinase [Shimia haliotis]SFK75667.1 Signal transduction histidine kinase [Shimia haliotis]
MSSNLFKRILRQSALRQALSLIAVFAVTSLIIWSATYWSVRSEINRLVDARLSTQMQAVVTALANDDPLPVAGFGQSIAVISGDRVVRGSLPFALSSVTLEDGFFRYDTNSYRVSDVRYLVQSVDDGQVIVLEDVERQDEVFEVMQNGLQGALIISLIAALITSLLIARRNQVRLDAIGDGLAKVAHGELSTRIDLPKGNDDLSLLALRIDATTARLEQSIDQIRVQSSNIAHDLRTPLARLRALIESRYIALETKKDPVKLEDLEAALAQIDRIVGTFDALLRIARIDSGARKSRFRKFDLGEVAKATEDTFGPVIEDAGQKLQVSIDAPAQVSGDFELLVQLVANLLQNALRYGSADQTISLKVHGRLLQVTDQGPGIPFAEHDKVLEPLYQLENARQGEGFGLGLSLVRSISQLHNAQLSLSDGPNGQGLSVALRFPRLTDL